MRPQHLEAGLPVGILVEAGHGIELADEAAGEAVGEAARFPRGQLLQDVGHVVGPVARFDAGHGVGLVLAVGEPGGIGVGGPLGAGIDRQPPHLLPAGDRIGMDRDEEVGLGARAARTRSPRETNTSWSRVIRTL